MATRKDKLCLAIRVLLRPVHLEHLWTATGPSPEAMHLRHTGGTPLSGVARVLVLAALDLWDREGHALFGEMLHILEADHLDRLFGLALAVKMDDDEIMDEWLAQYDPEARVRPIRH